MDVVYNMLGIAEADRQTTVLESGRRLKILRVWAGLMPEFFLRDDAKQPGQSVTISGFPKDGRMVGVHYDVARNEILFQVESDEFPPVQPGMAISEFKVFATRRTSKLAEAA